MYFAKYMHVLICMLLFHMVYTNAASYQKGDFYFSMTRKVGAAFLLFHPLLHTHCSLQNLIEIPTILPL